MQKYIYESVIDNAVNEINNKRLEEVVIQFNSIKISKVRILVFKFITKVIRKIKRRLHK